MDSFGDNPLSNCLLETINEDDSHEPTNTCSSNGLKVEESLLHAVSREDEINTGDGKEADFAYEDLDSNDNAINEEDQNQVEVNHAPTEAAIKGVKGKSINDILVYSKVEKGGNIKGRRNKNKCVVLRSAIASAALSAFLSSEGINKRNIILLDEAKAIWEVDKLFGIRYDGDEDEVVSKIAKMEAEALNKARADCQN